MLTSGGAAAIQRLLDEHAILQIVTRLARAQDDRDYDAYRSCFADEVLMDQPLVAGWRPQRVCADEWTRTVAKIFARFDVTHHRLSNHVVEVEGDSGRCRLDVSAIHQVLAAPSPRTCVVGGRYDLRLARGSDGAWRITERRLEPRYVTGDTTMTTLFAMPE